MLIKLSDLKKIRCGEINLIFRKWNKPRVRKGSLLKTAVGQIEILDIKESSLAGISSEEAARAGYNQVEDLMDALNARDSGQLYRIALRYHSPDPRLALRSKTDLTDEQFHKLKARLHKMDRLSKSSAWTELVLKTIQAHPHRRAADLAEMVGQDKDKLKVQIRKLKNLGLTISFETGYTLSPLGEAFMKCPEKSGT